MLYSLTMSRTKEYDLVSPGDLELVKGFVQKTVADFSVRTGRFDSAEQDVLLGYLEWLSQDGDNYVDPSSSSRVPLPTDQELIASGTNWTAYVPNVGLRRCIQSGPPSWVKTEEQNDIPQIFINKQNTRISVMPNLSWRHRLVLRSWRTEESNGKTYVNEMGRLQVPYSNLGALVIFKYSDGEKVSAFPHRLRLSSDKGEAEYTPMRILSERR